jgi:MFS family permease
VYRNRNALLFVGISLISGFGSTAMSLAAGLWVLDLTGSPSLAALCGLCVFAPTLAGPLLGALVDRLPRKTALIATNIGLAAVLMALFTVHSREQVWVVYAVSVAYGTSYVLLDAGESALLPSALPKELLAQVNGVRMSAQEGTKLLAPLAGAGLYAVAGARAVAVLTAACLLVSAALYVGVRATTTSERPKRSKGDAWRYLWANYRSPVLLAAAALFVSGFSDAAGYAVVVDQMGLPTAFMGVMSAAQGAGAILGGFATGRVPNLGPTGAAVFALGVAMKSVPWLPVNLAGSIVIGVGLPWTVVAAYTALQRGTPHDLLGRVSATATTLIFGSVALANPLGAAALSALGFFPARVIALLIIGYAVVTAGPIRTPIPRAARRTTDL